MKRQFIRYVGMAAALGTIAAAGCGRKSESPGVAEQSGTVLDRAADRTVEAGRATGAAVKDATGRAIERTGEALENAGAALDRKGADMQAPDATEE